MKETRFYISKKDKTKIQNWLIEIVYPKIIEKQKSQIKNPDIFYIECWKMGYPYTGAIGGGIKYVFIPTSLGMIFKVTYDDYELDLTDYDLW